MINLESLLLDSFPIWVKHQRYSKMATHVRLLREDNSDERL